MYALEKSLLCQVKNSEQIRDICMDHFDEDIVNKNEADGTLQELLFVGICHGVVPARALSEMSIG